MSMDDQKEIGVIGGQEKRDITLVVYNPEWPEKFQKHADIIKKKL